MVAIHLVELSVTHGVLGDGITAVVPRHGVVAPQLPCPSHPHRIAFDVKVVAVDRVVFTHLLRS